MTCSHLVPDPYGMSDLFGPFGRRQGWGAVPDLTFRDLGGWGDVGTRGLGWPFASRAQNIGDAGYDLGVSRRRGGTRRDHLCSDRVYTELSDRSTISA